MSDIWPGPCAQSRPERQALAKTFGADDIVDFAQGDPVEQIMELTGGKGSTPRSRRSGSPQTFEACLRVTKAGGRVSNRLPRGDPARCSCRWTRSAWA